MSGKGDHASRFRRNLMSSGAVSSVLFVPDNGTNPKTTKQGAFIYSGEASSFHEWEFRTNLRMLSAKEDKYQEKITDVVEALRGDAFNVSQQVGITVLMNENNLGHEFLVEAMRKMVFPYIASEAKELFQQFCKPGGVMSRQVGESMAQYVIRRERCWNLIKTLDSEITLGKGHIADLLLDLSGIDKDTKIKEHSL